MADPDGKPIVSLGFDVTADNGLCVAVLVRGADGTMHVEHAFAPPGVTEQDIRDFVTEHLRIPPDRPEPPKGKPMHELVTEWAARYVAGDQQELVLDDWQKAAIERMFEDGQVSHSSWISTPRNRASRW